MAKLPLKHERFAQEFLVDLNATGAYQRTYPDASAKSARTNGARLLAHARVQARIAELMQARAERVQVTQQDVLRRYWMIATANPNELIEYRRTCCRFCYGPDHGYQRTPHESESFGTVGFNARKPPNPECPECHGEGVGEAFVKDTRQLSPSALALYAGVKVTKDGIEVKMHNQADALTNAGRHLGMFTEKHELTGKNGAPLGVVHTIMFGDTEITF